MTVFRVVPKPWLGASADGRYTWKLPPTLCGTCGEPTGKPLGYPNLSIVGKVEEEPYTLTPPGDPRGPGGPIPRTEFEKLKKPLQSLLPAGKPLFPSMGFGPFRGTVTHSEKRDFVWVWLAELLPRESTYEHLLQAGVQIPTGPAIVKDRKTGEVRSDYERIVDLEIVPCMAIQTLEFTTESKHCPECGWRLQRPTKLFLKQKAIPKNLPIFASYETACIVASEEFVLAAKKLRLNNVGFQPITLV